MTSLANQLEVMTAERDRLREALKFYAWNWLLGSDGRTEPNDNLFDDGGQFARNILDPTPTAAPASAGVGEEKKGEVQREGNKESDPSCAKRPFFILNWRVLTKNEKIKPTDCYWENGELKDVGEAFETIGFRSDIQFYFRELASFKDLEFPTGKSPTPSESQGGKDL